MKRQKGLLVTGIALVILVGFAAQSDARVNINIGIGIPAYNFAAPPSLVVIPGTYAYFVPGVDMDILFYQGYWYRPYDGRWYRARGYNGPWFHIAPARVPRVLIGLPLDYRRLYGGHRHIEYGDFHRNWRRWERERYWDRDRWWRERGHERREERREDRRERRRDHRYGY